MTMHAGAAPDDLPEWKSLGGAVRTALVRGTVNTVRAFVGEVTTIRFDPGSAEDYLLNVAGFLTRDIMRAPPAGSALCDLHWAAAAGCGVVGHVLEQMEGFGPDDAGVTMASTDETAATISDAISRAIDPLIDASGSVVSVAFMASALLVHTTEIVALLRSLQVAEGWSDTETRAHLIECLFVGNSILRTMQGAGFGLEEAGHA